MTEQLTKQIAEAINESKRALIRKIITVIGAERTQAFLAQTQETITQGGLLRKDGQPRTAGGVFFYLVRGAISKEERRELFPYQKKPKRPGQANERPQAPGLTWQEAIPFIA